MGFVNIDAPGHAVDRRGVRAIQKAHGSADRKAAAQARRDARQARRAAPTAILFYPWPLEGVKSFDPIGAYCQGPNGDGQYQVIVVGTPKGSPQDYCDGVSKWVGLKLVVLKAEPMPLEPGPSTPERDAGYARGFLNIELGPAA